MKERGILMNAESVRAILDGRKVQTRRVVRPQPPRNAYFNEGGGDLVRFWVPATFASGSNHPIYDEEIRVPYQIGDSLWVRETFATREDFDGTESPERMARYTYYRATHSDFDPRDPHHWHNYGGRWRPSIHMPRWASRITLRVTDVRVERVQDISVDDARAEGIQPCQKLDSFSGLGYLQKLYGGAYYGMEYDNDWVRCVGPFACLWDSINDKRGFGWDTNPWIWVISFEKLDESK